MASEEERARIMAEYLAEAGQGDDDEEEFNDDDEDDDEDDEDDEEEEEEDKPTPPTILKGGLSLVKDDDGREILVYSGTWSFGVDAPQSSKFKYKSGPLPKGFKMDDIGSDPINFSGYFLMTDSSEDGVTTKIKEASVPLTFTTVEGYAGKRWTVAGSGTNDFGSFGLVGEYRFKTATDNKLHFEKVYVPAASNGDDDDDDDDDSADEDFDDEGGADEDELNALRDEAELSVEELRKRAYGGGGGGGDDGEQKTTKKKKPRKDEDEDDELTF